VAQVTERSHSKTVVVTTPNKTHLSFTFLLKAAVRVYRLHWVVRWLGFGQGDGAVRCFTRLRVAHAHEDTGALPRVGSAVCAVCARGGCDTSTGIGRHSQRKSVWSERVRVSVSE
jgi:hypothetical protein